MYEVYVGGGGELGGGGEVELISIGAAETTAS